VFLVCLLVFLTTPPDWVSTPQFVSLHENKRFRHPTFPFYNKDVYYTHDDR